VEVCHNILGFELEFSSFPICENVNLEPLYYRMTRLMNPHLELEGNDAMDDSITFTTQGTYADILTAYKDRGPMLANLCYWEYRRFVSIKRATTRLSSKVMVLPFAEGSALTGHWKQLEEQEDNKYFLRNATLLPAFFVPWDSFLSSRENPISTWTRLKSSLPARLAAVVDATTLLHCSKEGARRDARMWAEHGERLEEYFLNDAGNKDHEDPTNTEAHVLQEDSVLSTFSDLVNHVTNTRAGVIQTSASLLALGEMLTSGPGDLSELDPQHSLYADLWRPSNHKHLLNQTTKAQRLLDTSILRTIQGGDKSPECTTPGVFHNGPATLDGGMPSVILHENAIPNIFTTATAIASEQGLNKNQKALFLMVADALNRHKNNPDNCEQFMSYLGGEAGTGKSRVIIKAFAILFAQLGQSSAIMFTASSGAAAAEIDGNPYHQTFSISD
ncbi:hypothetical protein DFS34DRAFT_668539, partial [Phlyctochytrium arcticum]